MGGGDEIAEGIRQQLPHYAEGTIVKGFGRGSTELGFPTANFPEDVIDGLPEQLIGGIYWGFAQVQNGPVYGMVMSIGWNPFYNNTKRAMETHILHEFEPFDLYGQHLRVVIADFLRPESDFVSLQALKDAIANDIKNANKEMEKEEFSKLRSDPFFQRSIKDIR